MQVIRSEYPSTYKITNESIAGDFEKSMSLRHFLKEN